MKDYTYNSYQFVNKSIDKSENNYTASELKTQHDFIELLINYIHVMKEDEGFSLDGMKKHIMNLPEEFIYSIMHPKIDEFYSDRTIKLIGKDKKLLEMHVASFLDKKIPIEDLGKGDYTLDISQSIGLAIECYVSHLFKDKNCISDELINMREKYVLGNFDSSYVSKLSSYIYDLNNVQLKNYFYLFLNRMKRDYSPLVNNILKNYPKFVNVTESEEKLPDDKKTMSIEEFDLNSSDSKIDDSRITKPNYISVSLTPFNGKPIYSENETNNINLFIYTDFLPFVIHHDSFMKLHEIFIKQDKRAKTALNEVFYTSFVGKKLYSDSNYKLALCKRIKSIAEFLNNFNLLQHYNNTNNARLDRIDIPELKFDYDELFEDLTDLNKLYNYSQEALLGLSAFYTNRSSKIATDFCKSIFVINKLKSFDDIYNNDDFEYKDLKLSDAKLKEYMAQYDLLTDIFKNYFRINSDNPTHSLVVDFSEEEHANNYFKLYNLTKDAYEKRFPNQYDDDFDFITSHSCNLENFLYKLKTQSIQSLIYTALMDNKKNIINWGYINENNKSNNSGSSKILVGFDIQTLNMPIKFHIPREDLVEIVKYITGSTSIPYYVGENDLKGTYSGDLTTQIVDVVSKDRKKAILKNNRQSLFFNHIKWMQKASEKPEYLKNIPEKFYNLVEPEVNKILDVDEEEL